MAEAPTATLECSSQHRCGNCRKDTQVAAQLRVREARKASLLLPKGQQQCSECTEPKNVEDFFLNSNGNPTSRCIDCEICKRREWSERRNARNKRLDRKHGRYACANNCGNDVGRKGARCLACYSKKSTPQTSRRILSKAVYACIGECGTMLSKEKTRCRPCTHVRQKVIATSAETNTKNKRVMKSFANGQTFGVMIIGEDVFSLTQRCPVCQKAVLVQTKCYQCSTGRAITLDILPQIFRSLGEITQLDEKITPRYITI